MNAANRVQLMYISKYKTTHSMSLIRIFVRTSGIFNKDFVNIEKCFGNLNTRDFLKLGTLFG